MQAQEMRSVLSVTSSDTKMKGCKDKRLQDFKDKSATKNSEIKLMFCVLAQATDSLQRKNIIKEIDNCTHFH